jgi:hypothetical protein
MMRTDLNESVGAAARRMFTRRGTVYAHYRLCANILLAQKELQANYLHDLRHQMVCGCSSKEAGVPTG